jgi:hypothetical protein
MTGTKFGRLTSVPAASSSSMIERYVKIKTGLDKILNVSSSILFPLFQTFLLRIEGFRKEDCHLGAGGRVFRPVITIPIASSNPLCCQLLDPGRGPIIRRQVSKVWRISRKQRNLLGMITGRRDYRSRWMTKLTVTPRRASLMTCYIQNRVGQIGRFCPTLFQNPLWQVERSY